MDAKSPATARMAETLQSLPEETQRRLRSRQLGSSPGPTAQPGAQEDAEQVQRRRSKEKVKGAPETGPRSPPAQTAPADRRHSVQLSIAGSLAEMAMLLEEAGHNAPGEGEALHTAHDEKVLHVLRDYEAADASATLPLVRSVSQYGRERKGTTATADAADAATPTTATPTTAEAPSPPSLSRPPPDYGHALDQQRSSSEPSLLVQQERHVIPSAPSNAKVRSIPRYVEQQEILQRRLMAVHNGELYDLAAGDPEIAIGRRPGAPDGGYITNVVTAVNVGEKRRAYELSASGHGHGGDDGTTTDGESARHGGHQQPGRPPYHRRGSHGLLSPSATEAAMAEAAAQQDHPMVEQARTGRSHRTAMDADKAASATLRRMQRDYEQRNAVDLREAATAMDARSLRRRMRAKEGPVPQPPGGGGGMQSVGVGGSHVLGNYHDAALVRRSGTSKSGRSRTMHSHAATLKKMRLAAQLAEKDGLMIVPPLSLLRSPITTIYSRHQDFYPDQSKRYYMPIATQSRRMCVVIPCYNEDSDALKRTLKTLHCQLKHLGRLDFDLHVVVILDGWAMASDSMKTYCQTMFDMPENVERHAPTWWDDLNEEEDNPVVETFVIQNVDTQSWCTQPVYIDADSSDGGRDMLNLSLIVKRDNRRKHNTLEWFFRSFALELGAECECGAGQKQKRAQHGWGVWKRG